MQAAEHPEMRSRLTDKIDAEISATRGEGFATGLGQALAQTLEDDAVRDTTDETTRFVGVAVAEGMRLLLRHQAESKFGSSTARELAAILDEITSLEALCRMGCSILDCQEGEALVGSARYALEIIHRAAFPGVGDRTDAGGGNGALPV